MAAGAYVISGAYAVNDTAGIAGFINAKGQLSGQAIFTYPSANGLQVYVGVMEKVN